MQHIVLVVLSLADLKLILPSVLLMFSQAAAVLKTDASAGMGKSAVPPKQVSPAHLDQLHLPVTVGCHQEVTGLNPRMCC